jgi:hypothetical protein
MKVSKMAQENEWLPPSNSESQLRTGSTKMEVRR